MDFVSSFSLIQNDPKLLVPEEEAAKFRRRIVTEENLDILDLTIDPVTLSHLPNQRCCN